MVGMIHPIATQHLETQMPSPYTLIFVFLAGLGCGLALSVVAMAWVSKATGEPMRYRPTAELEGLEVRDSSMGEFDAAVRGRA